MTQPEPLARLHTLPSSATATVHGGPDALGIPTHDFSTNSNACGPCPHALLAVQSCDANRYPDPAYTVLRQQLANFHGVEPWRVVLAGSASEFIYRITAWVARQGGRQVSVPVHSYGDYTHAAKAWGLATVADANAADLVWCCEPSSPLGGAHGLWPQEILAAPTSSTLPPSSPPSSLPLSPYQPQRATVLLDCAYAPLRLQGAPSLAPGLNTSPRTHIWHMFSPNKALGLTGVRAAYAIAPLGAQSAVLALNALAASWVVGAHGVALLHAWVQPEVQAWLAQSLHTLRLWKAQQIDMLTGLGWTCLPSDANFFCARPAQGLAGNVDLAAWTAELLRLRHKGIKLRDTASFGLPGHARLGVLPPAAQQALRLALMQINPPTTPVGQNSSLQPIAR